MSVEDFAFSRHGIPFPEQEKQCTGSYIDSASVCCLLLVLSVSIGFFIGHIFISLRAPRTISWKQTYFPIPDRFKKPEIDIDVTVADLHDVHRFVELNCVLVRRVALFDSSTVHVTVASRTLFLKNYTVTNSMNVKKQRIHVAFPAGDDRSTSFRLLQKEILEYDAAQVKLTLGTDLASLDGCHFQWSTADPSALSYARVARTVMSLVHGYVLILCLALLTPDRIALTELFCLVLGIAGLLTCNPASLVLPTTIQTAPFSNDALMATYIGLLRMFCLLQLEAIRSKQRSVNWRLTGCCAVFFVFYGFFDASASFDRGQQRYESDVELEGRPPSEDVVVMFHVVHVVLAAVWIVAAGIQSKRFLERKLLLFILVTIADCLATAFSQILCPSLNLFAFTVLPEVVHVIVHLTAGACAIFLLHPSANPTHDKLRQRGLRDDGIVIESAPVIEAGDFDDKFNPPNSEK
jgi:hypothetical protein